MPTSYDWIMRDKHMCWNALSQIAPLKCCPHGQLWVVEFRRVIAADRRGVT